MFSGEENEQRQTQIVRDAHVGKIRKSKTFAKRLRQRRNRRAVKHIPRAKSNIRETLQAVQTRQKRNQSRAGVCRLRKDANAQPRRKTTLHTCALLRLYVCKKLCRRAIPRRQKSVIFAQ